MTQEAADASHKRRAKLLHRIVPMTSQDSDVPVFWSRAALAVCLLVVLLCVAFEVWLIDCESGVHETLKNDAIRLNLDPVLSANLNIDLTVSFTYHAVFFLSLLFWLFLVWDAVMSFNTLQVLSINAYNVAVFVYSILQLLQIEADASNTSRMFRNDPGVLAYLGSANCKTAPSALPIFTSLFIPIFAYLTIKLKADFGWRKYRIAGGDKDLERAFVWYHNFLLLQKFSFLFVLSFGSINSVLVTAVTDEIPFAPAILSVVVWVLPFAGHHAVRRERKKLGCLVVLMYLVTIAMCAYTLWFTLQSWQAFKTNEKRFTYDRMRNTLLLYAVLTMMVLCAAAGTGAFCVWSFGRGLKNALDKERLRVQGEQKAQHIDLDA
ncbi:hypothetical protein BJ741DRAFT_624398 [Chytriomyces cf. hyalinus JEL632]|nr:hypothetical protein BJ741DRAFT_624398 [Chytriomyces cf. hyalinus JEL632]